MYSTVKLARYFVKCVSLCECVCVGLCKWVSYIFLLFLAAILRLEILKSVRTLQLKSVLWKWRLWEMTAIKTKMPALVKWSTHSSDIDVRRSLMVLVLGFFFVGQIVAVTWDRIWWEEYVDGFFFSFHHNSKFGQIFYSWFQGNLKQASFGWTDEMNTGLQIIWKSHGNDCHILHIELYSMKIERIDNNYERKTQHLLRLNGKSILKK